MRRETTRSLPGMARAESTTVSPGPSARSRCSSMATARARTAARPGCPDDERYDAFGVGRAREALDGDER